MLTKLVNQNKRRRNNEVVEYGIRKMHSFYDCVPTVVGGDQFSYGEMNFSDISRVVKFNFAWYQLNTLRGVLDASL